MCNYSVGLRAASEVDNGLDKFIPKAAKLKAWKESMYIWVIGKIFTIHGKEMARIHSQWTGFALKDYWCITKHDHMKRISIKILQCKQLP